MKVNDPAVVARVRAAFDSYETALMANDVQALDGFFWADRLAVRYGVAENLYGAEAIAAYRRSCRPPGPRRLHQTVVVTFGRDLGTVSTEYRERDLARAGRQSQTWVNLPEGWRVVAAHVSLAAGSS